MGKRGRPQASQVSKTPRWRWTLRTRIVLGYVIMSGLAMIVTVAAILSVRIGYQLQDSGTQRIYALRNDALELQVALMQQLAAAQEFVQSGDEYNLALHEAGRAQFQRILQEIQPQILSAEEQQLLLRVETSSTHIQNQLDLTIAARQVDEVDSATLYWQNVHRLAHDELIPLLEKFVTYEEEQLLQRNELVRRGSLTILILSIVTLFVALATSVALSGFMAQRATATVQDVVQATQSITAGNLEIRLQPAGPPEMQALAQAVNHMAEALQSSRQQLQASLEEARTRSSELERLTDELQRNEHELSQRLKEATTLRQASLAVTSSLDLEEVLVHIMQAVIYVVPVEAASLMLIDHERQDLVFEMSLMGDRLVRELFRIPMGVGVAGWVAQHSEPLLIPDVSQDPRFYQKVDEDTGFVTHSIVCVPVIVHGETIGVFEVINRLEGLFTEEDLELLTSFAAPVGIALENARLFDTVERERGRLEAILTGTADVVVVTNAEGQITLFNPAAERAFGLQAEEAKGQPIGEALPHTNLVHTFQQAVESSSTPMPAELLLEDGRTLFFSISPVADPKGEGGWVWVMQDITHLKELDRMKNEFVATVSHDLKTPLTSIRGYADLIATLGQVDERQRQFIHKIKQASDNMSQLVSDLLDIAKIEAGLELDIAPCPLEEVCSEIEDDFYFKAQQRQQTMEFCLPEHLPQVYADRKRLHQILSNIVGNALKYTPEGGSIHIAAEQYGGQIVTRIQDNGIGIPTADLPYIFDKFYRVKGEAEESIEGTGLGLSIVKSIVEQHGGRVWVESELGHGSTFFFALPAAGNGGQSAGMHAGAPA